MFKLFSIVFLKLLLFVSSFYSFSQNSKELLFSNKWKNTLGNTFDFSDSSFVFDGFSRRLDKPYLGTIITDSTFLCYYTEDFNNFGKDTMFYFEYKVNEDSLMLCFKPTWFRVDKKYYSECSFSHSEFCKLVNKKLLFYSDLYLKKTNKNFEFQYYESKPYGGELYIKLFMNGDFIFSTLKNVRSIPERRGEYSFSGRYRTFNGVYRGQLSKNQLDTVMRQLFYSKDGLQSYLHKDHAINKEGEFYSNVKGRDGVFPSNSTAGIILESIAFKTKNIYFTGIHGDEKSESVVIYPKPTILPHTKLSKEFYHGLYAAIGHVKRIKTLKVEDSINFLYSLKVKKFLAKNNTEINTEYSTLIVSPFKLSTDSIGIIYSKKNANFIGSDGYSKSLVYYYLEDTFTLKKHFIFEYIDTTDYSRNQYNKIEKLKPIKSVKYSFFERLFENNKNHSKMDRKISKAIRRNLIKNGKE